MENTSNRPKVARRQEAVIARVVEEMRKEPARPWTMAELAHIAQYEELYFTSLCRKLTRQSPIRLRTSVRGPEASKVHTAAGWRDH